MFSFANSVYYLVTDEQIASFSIELYRDLWIWYQLFTSN